VAPRRSGHQDQRGAALFAAAVDQDGACLDVLAQHRRNATAAKKFLRKLLKGLR